VTGKTQAGKSTKKKQHGQKAETGEEKVNISGKAVAVAREEKKKTGAVAAAAPKPTKEELLREEVDKLKDDQLRDRAEMENTRKRLEKHKQEAIRYASIPLIRELLTVIDNLELALKYSAEDDPLRNGVNMALDGMKKTLTDHNCKPIQSVGQKFDPAFHEALTTTHDPGKDDDVVLEEHRTGYVLHDRVVRAAGVIVNKKPAEPAEPAEPEKPKEEAKED
jgi:molecular chaperone GrpE